MRTCESGMTLLEVIIASTIGVMLTGLCLLLMIQIFNHSQKVSDHLFLDYQIDRAGFWIGQDAQKAVIVSTTGLESPQVLVLQWTEWNFGGDSVYHSVVYSVEDAVDGVGRLKRFYQNSKGQSSVTWVAEEIYYNPQDEEHSTRLSYDNGILSVVITAVKGEEKESRQYRIHPRPDYTGA